MPDNTGSKQAETQFKPGQSGNPNGRPKGARAKLGEDFLKALLADFNEPNEEGTLNGIEAIKSLRTDKPADYARVIASILPKELTGEDGGPIIAEIRRTLVRP